MHEVVEAIFAVNHSIYAARLSGANRYRAIDKVCHEDVPGIIFFNCQNI